MERAGGDISGGSNITSCELEPRIVLSLRLTLLIAALADLYLLVDLLVRSHSPFNLAFGIFVIAILAIVIWLYTRIAISFAVTDFGLQLVTILGSKESIKWAEIRLLRGKRNRAVLVSEDRPIYYLYLFPKDAMMSLAAVLREASNARVIGFGEKL
ncbi:MAG: hypothetical protein K6T99_07255 [Armatimonadetes bacterium]|nr:hypothetical protein [Armatimonadota bacterium]